MPKTKEEMLAYQRSYWATHPEYREKAKQRQKSPERIAYQKAYRDAHKKEIREKRKKYHLIKYHSNIEESRLQSRLRNHSPSAIKWRSANAERIKSLNREWSKNNRDKRNATLAKLRARRCNAPGWDYTTVEHINARRAMFGNKCWMCGCTATEIDHVKPLSKGGSHWPANLRPICKKCNQIKKNKLITVDPAQPPAGFKVSEKNPELAPLRQ